MVPDTLTNFFLASAGIGATLVGLIFVAVSISPEHNVQANAPIERQAMAASSFTALLNAFFISFGALIPGSIAPITLIMSTIGLINSLLLAWNLLKERERWQNVVRRIFLILVSIIIYGYEFYYAMLIILQPDSVGNIYTLAALLLGVYGIGLTRAWQLLGARRFGLGGWLSPLRELNETTPIRVQEEAEKSNQTVHDELR
ncbi:MAG TPA: hypothetical protein VNW73_17400 [Ktedonobacteraceae bacterium]|jgi:hypothetical protein|nr:hypothetical protein [Ktedonobacteraceae bacterium]